MHLLYLHAEFLKNFIIKFNIKLGNNKLTFYFGASHSTVNDSIFWRFFRQDAISLYFCILHAILEKQFFGGFSGGPRFRRFFSWAAISLHFCILHAIWEKHFSAVFQVGQDFGGFSGGPRFHFNFASYMQFWKKKIFGGFSGGPRFQRFFRWAAI